MDPKVIQKKDLLIILLLIFNLGFTVGLYRTVLTQNISQNTQISVLNEDYLGLQSDVSEIKGRLEGPREIYRHVEGSVVKVRALNQKWGTSYKTGSGFIYDPAGYIITNAHVIDGASEIDVTFSDGTIFNVSVVGVDVYSDLAVIKTDRSLDDHTPAQLGNSSNLVIGDPILAVGNPYGLSGSMTSGIVSQTDRVLNTEGGYTIVGVIQVDAAVNPGNSGGPLLNYRGEVIGVNTAIASKTGEFTGVGFAVPSNLVKLVVPSLIDEGVYKHPWLGIQGIDMTPRIANIMNLTHTSGVYITSIIEGGPAEKAGLKASRETIIVDDFEIGIGGDLIISVNGHPVKGMSNLVVYLEYHTRPRDVVTLDIIRDGEKLTLDVELGERPLPDSNEQ